MKICTNMYLFIATKEYKIVVEKLSCENLVVFVIKLTSGNIHISSKSSQIALQITPKEICSALFSITTQKWSNNNP